MKKVKIALATTLTTITMTFVGSAFAGDAAMHMEFYLEDKITEPANLPNNNDVIRARSIQSPKVTSSVEQLPEMIHFVEVKPAPKKIFQQRIYSVRSGDTLIKISRKTGIDVLELARLNQIKYKDLNHIKVGQKLNLI